MQGYLYNVITTKKTKQNFVLKEDLRLRKFGKIRTSEARKPRKFEKNKNIQAQLNFDVNPLTAEDVYFRSLIECICRRCSAFHRQNHEKRPRIFRKRIKFATK